MNENKKILNGHLPVIPRPRFLHHGFRQPLALCMRKKRLKSLSLPELELFQKFTIPLENLQFHWKYVSLWERFWWLMMALTPKRLFLYLCISISLLRPYTLFSRSPLVNKTLYERGSVSTVVCHLFVVRVLERSAMCSQALCVVSGEASANFERLSRSHCSLDSRQQAILV